VAALAAALVALAIPQRAALFGRTVPQQQVAVGALFQVTNLHYDCGFLVPHGTDANGVSYGQAGFGAIAYSPSGNSGQGSLYVSGDDNQRKVGELSIPTCSGSAGNIATWPTATILSPQYDPGEGHIGPCIYNQGYLGHCATGTVPSNLDYKLGGMLVYPFDGSSTRYLYLQDYSYYDAGNVQQFTASRRGLSLSGTSWDGMYQLSPFSPPYEKYVDGTLSEVDPAYTSALGGTIISEHTGAPIVSIASQGFAATIWNPLSSWGQPISSQLLLGYDGDGGTNPHRMAVALQAAGYAYPAGEVTSANTWWNLTMHVHGTMMPTGYRSHLYFGRIGTTYCYGNGDAYPPLVKSFLAGSDPAGGNSGNNASSNGAGTVITLPGADLSYVATNHYGLWLNTGAANGTTHAISATANSGLSNAQVTITPAVAAGLSGVDYALGVIGIDASTNSAGDTITVPNAVLDRVQGAEIHLLNQTTPNFDDCPGWCNGGLRSHPGVGAVLSVANSGTGSATVGSGGFPGNLTNQPYMMGDINCDDPQDRTSKGNHGYPYANYLNAYDLNDFLAVKAGSKHAYEPIPYLHADITSLLNTAMGTGGASGGDLLGLAHDRTHKTIYIAMVFIDGTYPVILKFHYD
jgi:hypothetical protein